MDLPSEVLPTPGGPTKHRMEPFRSGFRLRHGQVFEDAVLDLLQAVMIFVQDLPGALDVQLILRRDRPGQFRQPLEVGPQRRILGRDGRDAFQALKLALRLHPGQIRQARFIDLLAQVGQVLALPFAVFAEFPPDGLHLLSEIVLALGLAHLVLDLRLDAAARLRHFDFLGDQERQRLQPVLDVAQFQHGLLVFERDLQVEGDEIGHLGGLVLQVEQGNPQLLGHGRDQFDQPLELLRQVVGQGLAFHGIVFPLSLKLHPGTHDGLGFEDFQHPGAGHTVDDGVEAVFRQLHHLVYPYQGTVFVEIVRRRPVRLGVPLCQDQHHLVLLQRFVQRLDGTRPVGHQRGGHVGIHDQVAHGQHGD